MSRTLCNDLYSAVRGANDPSRITTSMFCAGNIEINRTEIDESSCVGDSGGPIVEADTGILIGVVSRGYITCDKGGFPTMYTRVGKFRKFINEYLQDDLRPNYGHPV